MYFTVVLHGPDDATVCEGRSTTFTCVLNRNHWNGSMDILLNSDDVKWYRDPLGISSTERIEQGSNIHFNNSALNSSLTITNAVKSYTGYYWVGTPYNSVCNASLTVTTSMYMNANHHAYTQLLHT